MEAFRGLQPHHPEGSALGDGHQVPEDSNGPDQPGSGCSHVFIMPGQPGGPGEQRAPLPARANIGRLLARIFAGEIGLYSGTEDIGVGQLVIFVRQERAADRAFGLLVVPRLEPGHHLLDFV